MRRDQKSVVAGERWEEANQVQQGILILLDSITGANRERLSMDVTTKTRNVFQRLFPYHCNGGPDERAGRFRACVEDMQSMMM